MRGSLDEPTDGQQDGSGRIDSRSGDVVSTAIACAGDGDGGGGGGGGVSHRDVAGLLTTGRRQRTDHARDGPPPAFARRTAAIGTVRRLHRADGTVVGGRGGAAGPRGVTMVGRPPSPSAAASGRVPAQQQRLERVSEVFQVVRVQQWVARRVEVRQHYAAVDQ